MKQHIFFLSATISTLLSNARSGNALRLMLLSLITLLPFGMCSPAAYAQTYQEQTLYSFDVASSGSEPTAAVINVNGILYGTTNAGGDYSDGTIFAIKPDGTQCQTLYSFQGGTGDGDNPFSGLVSLNGILYGTTRYGGSTDNNGKGYGTVFSLDPSSDDEKKVCSFGTNDQSPLAGLIAVNGLLYGTTAGGTIFSVDPSSQVKTTLYQFHGSSDGTVPTANLLDVNGIFYGTTEFGGALNDGTVFSFDPTTNIEHAIYTFSGTGIGKDGRSPIAGLIDVNGILYGTTTYGGTDDDGTVFSINPDGTGYRVLYSFTNMEGDGAEPYGPLLNLNGVLYGTTAGGGINNDGTVFSFDPGAGKETTLYRFSPLDMNGRNGDGAQPEAGLLNVSGTLYGTTELGGLYGGGAIFSLTPITDPIAHNDGCTIRYNSARTNPAPGVLSNDSNGGEGPLTAALVSTTMHGSLTLNSDGSFTYTPNTGYAGTDTFTYRAVNPIGQSNIATVTLTVIGALPVAHNDGCSIRYNTARTNNAPGVLYNDDYGGSAVTTALVSNVTHGTLALHTDGSFTYAPNTGYAGTDSFTYKDTNSVGTGNTATVTLTIIPTTPLARNDGCTIKHNTARTIAAPGVMVNDDNGGSSPMTASLVTSVAHGTLSFHSDGSFTYTPNTGYSGTDTFTYKDTTAIGTSNTATVTLTVQ